jgi:alkylation response protein AidB-like acyl-CoA dehydrogenase
MLRETNGLSYAERTLLRRSVRDLLANIWPADRAVENSTSAHAVAKLWDAMAKQGLSSLGAHAEEGGLREV